MTKNDPLSINKSQILWWQVWGLAAIQGAIALTWVIYNLYLKKLLTDFGFPPALATTILIIENILAAIMEPLMGNFSDQTQRWLGSRFPFISIGVILSSIFFIAIPTIFVFGNASNATRGLLPVFLVAWALAMTVFRSPALSLLGRYAFATKLPQAASILTLVGGVAGAMAPLASQFILDLGAMFAFTIGSLTLLAAAAALRLVNPDLSISSENIDLSQSKLSLTNLGFIFGVGVGVGLGFRLMMLSFPQILSLNLPETNKSLVIGAIFISLAVTAIPAGNLGNYLGNKIAMTLGLVIMSLFCAMTLLAHHGIIATVIAIGFGAAFSLVSNGTIPFALSLVPNPKAGLGTGIYFSGGAVASSLFGAIFSQPQALTPTLGAILAAVSFLIAAIVVFTSK